MSIRKNWGVILLLGIGLLAVGYVVFFPESKEDTLQEPLTEQEVPSPNEEFTEAEKDVLTEKVAKLAKKEHYNENVEQQGREGQYQRTSYYDKPIGRILAPHVHIDELIYAGASELNMRRGVATVEYQERLTEQTVAIAGHRSKNPTQFLTGSLYLKIGDKVKVQRFKDGTEEVEGEDIYVVDEMFAVTPKDVWVLEEQPKDTPQKLVLITCYNYNSQTKQFDERYIVYAYKKP